MMNKDDCTYKYYNNNINTSNSNNNNNINNGNNKGSTLSWKIRKKSQFRLWFSLPVLYPVIICTFFANVDSQLFGSNEVVNCNEIFSVEEAVNGTIQTLGYPNPYPERRHCKVQLRGSTKHRVIIKFEDFYLYHPFGEIHRKHSSSCNGLDTLHVYDGLDETFKMLGEYCGGERPLPLMSSGPNLSLRLTSYTSGSEARGYLAKYYFVKNYGIHAGKQKANGECSFEFDSALKKEGKITSPNPGGIYPTNTNCSYIFDGSFLERVLLKFHYFDLEGIEPCTARSGSDFLEFSSLPGFDPCPARRCGRFTPQEIVSEGPYFRITFRSNDRLNGLGFSASYKFVTDEQLPDWASYLKGGADKLALKFPFSWILLWNFGAVIILKFSGISF